MRFCALARVTLAFVVLWSRQRIPRVNPGATALDVALVLVATALMQTDVWVRHAVAGPRALMSALLLFATVPLLWRRRAPLAVVVVVMGAVITQALATGNALEGNGGILPFLVTIYSVAAYGGPRRALVGGAIVLLGGIVHSLEDTTISTPGQQWADAFAYLLTLAAWLVGMYVHRHREAAQLRERAGRSEREAELARAEERSRIARELHDIVSHTLSVMVVQADAGELIPEGEQARAREAFRAIQGTGRQALDEMRRLLGILRAEEAEVALAPQPGVRDLQALVEQVSDAGLPATLDISGDPHQLPPGLGLAVYRIIQEGLTNALKHAGPARARVHLRYGERALEIEVRDDGPGTSTNGNGGGHGLVGIRERVELYGGELEAGPVAGGGYTLSARLPLTPSS